jgi:hypothetical protein
MRGSGGRGVRRIEVKTRFEKKFVDRLEVVFIDSGGEWQTRLSISVRKTIPAAHFRFPTASLPLLPWSADAHSA